MTIFDVVIQGLGYRVCVSLTALSSATALVKELLQKRHLDDEVPLPLYDADNHMIGFVVPATIQSTLIETRDQDPADPLGALTRKLLTEQLNYYTRLNASMD